MSSGQQSLKLLEVLPESYKELAMNIQSKEEYRTLVPGNPLVRSAELDFNRIFDKIYKRALLEITSTLKSTEGNDTVLYAASKSSGGATIGKQGVTR